MAAAADEAALATLVRLHAALGAHNRADKARAIVEAAARDFEQLKAAFAARLQADTAVGRSAYSADAYDFYALVDATFWALNESQGCQAAEKLRATVYVLTLQLLHSSNATSVAPRLVQLLLQQLHNLRVVDLAAAVSEILRGVSYSQRSEHRGDSLCVFYTIELLPQLLLRVSSSMMLSFEVSPSDSVVGDLSGPDYRQEIITKLTALAWPRRFFLQVMKCFRDLHFSPDEERSFCIKIYREARKELNSASDQARALEIFPTVCLNVLQLVGRIENALCTRLLTRLLINKCQQLTTAASERSGETSFLRPGPAELSDRDLRALQSTVLYHVDMVMRQWEQLGNAVMIEYEQRSPHRLSSFDISLLLLVASHKKYEAQVMDHLLRYIIGTYHSLPSRPSDNREEALSRKAFIHVIQHAQDGSWAPILDQAVGLGFRLVEYQAHGGIRSSTVAVSSTRSRTSSDWIDFGTRLLLACFQFHQSSREKILDRVVNMIVVQDSNCTTSIHVMSRIVHRHVTELGGHLDARIRECLEYVTHIEPQRANNLLVALSPLFKTQPNLKSFVVLILRKAMFRKDEESRIIGIQGFAYLLCLSSRIFSRSRTLSQLYSQNVAMLSQGGGNLASTGPYASATDIDIASQEQTHALVAEDLYRQFSGVFRRALQLQTQVRLVLYAELIKVYDECPALRQSILGLLYQHFQKYYEFNESVQPPLKLDLALSKKRGVYEEPLGYLLHAILYCYMKMKAAESICEEDEETMMEDIPTTQTGGGNQLLENMDDKLCILLERLQRCELSDFDFDKNSPFSAESDLGEFNRRMGCLVMEVFEVAIDFWATRDISDNNSLPLEKWDMLLHLGRLHSWIQRRISGYEGSGKEGQCSEKKLNATRKKLKLQPQKDPSGGTCAHSSASNSDYFMGAASFEWATLITPRSLLKILEFVSKKATETGDGRSALSSDEEGFSLVILGKCNSVLDLLQKKTTHEVCGSQKHPTRRRSPHLTRGDDLHYFTIGLCDSFLRLLRIYCNEHVSLKVTSNASRKRASTSEDVPPQDRMRLLVRGVIQGLAKIVGIWCRLPGEEFEELLVRSLCVHTSDIVNSPDYEVEGDDDDGVARVLPPLHKLIDQLLSHQMPDEALLVLMIVEVVWMRVSSTSTGTRALEPSLAWGKDLLISQSDRISPRLAEKLVSILLRPYVDRTFQTDLAQMMAQGLRYYCNNGGEEDGNMEQPSIVFTQLNEKSVLTVANAVLGNIEEALIDTERSIKTYDQDQRRQFLRFKEEDLSALQQLEDETGSQVFGQDNGSGGPTSYAVFKRLGKQLHDLAGCLRPFVAMNLNNTAASIRIVRLIGRLFKMLVLLVKDKLRRKDASLPKILRQLFDRTASDLSPALLQFIACIHDESHRTGRTKTRGRKPGVGKATPGKSKFIPEVVYQLEQFDLVMIKLSKLCKGHDFVAWCKLRQSRDFRLNKDRIQRSLSEAGMKSKVETREEVVNEQEEDVHPTSTGTMPEAALAAEESGDSANDDTESAGDDEEDALPDNFGRARARKRSAHEANLGSLSDNDDVGENDDDDTVSDRDTVEEDGDKAKEEEN